MGPLLIDMRTALVVTDPCRVRTSFASLHGRKHAGAAKNARASAGKKTRTRVYFQRKYFSKNNIIFRNYFYARLALFTLIATIKVK